VAELLKAKCLSMMKDENKNPEKNGKEIKKFFLKLGPILIP